MNTSYISATDLKKNISEVLSRVYYEKQITIVKRHDEPIVKMVPMEKTETKKDIAAILDKYYGIMPDFPDVTKMRKFRKRTIKL